MFGFFKKNKNKNDNTVHSIASPVVASPVVASPVAVTKPSLSLDELIEIVSKKWVARASASLFFAQCGGFAHQVIGYDEKNFMKYYKIVLQGDSNQFKAEDKVKALSFFSIEAPREFKKVFEEYEPEELAEAMLNLAISKRERDWLQLVSKVDEKFEFIGPIFQRLLNSNIDKYGEVDWEPSLDEAGEFINRFFTDEDFDFYYRVKPISDLLSYIEEKLEREADPQSAPIPLDGIEFEHWTANELSRQGWQAQVSQASGDQGVDVMAKRDGCSVAIQCKRYSKPVGNKAVQEVFAAKQFSSADHACVIGTGGFTRSARELAGATGVVLLEAEAGLQNFSNSFGFDTEMLEVDESDDVALEFNFDSNNEAKKAIIKSFFSIQVSIKDTLDARGEDTPDIPDVLLDNFDPDTGEGSAKLDANDLITLLVYSDLHLSGEADISDGVREQFRSSDTLWQKKIGEDESILTVTGILGYGSTTPKEIKDEFCSFWELCEMFLGFESDDPYRQALNEIYRERMEESRPKILDADF